jgi:transforming growth factor-beta-induced protein
VNISPSRRTRFALATVAVLSLTAAACGSDDTASDSTSAPAASAAPASDAPMETTMDTMDSSAGAMLEPSGPGCAAVPSEGDGSFGGMADDPAATAASANPLLSTLVAAVTAADLGDTLNGDGPFTIFAPTNDAFAAIPPADLDAVLADTDLLTSILTYHVIAGESLSSADLVAAGTETTVNGEDLTFTDDNGTLVVNGVPTVCMDVPTANATVHIIGSVLMPMGDAAEAPMDTTMDTSMDSGAMLEPSGPGCASVPTEGDGSFGGMADDPAATAASANPLLSTLVTAVTEAGLVDTLNGEGPFTIFAPTNDAFAAIPPADLEAVLADTDLLTSILTYHVVAGEKMSSADLIAAGTVATVNGEDLTITDDGGTLVVNGVPTVCMDVPTANATVHIIGSVLMP